ncbi:MAG: UDP-N-acetylmuramoyl-L-alanyl-D-glutamate--2,6-diaminopimelate ligase, partial [Chitinophagaceae bacterium]
MVLKDVISGVAIKQLVGETSMELSALVFDSRKAGNGAAFIAIKGTITDGHDYIDQVIKAGVRCIICENMPAQVTDDVTYVIVEDSAKALGLMAANFFEHPSDKLNLVGVTGTNGKTT